MSLQYSTTHRTNSMTQLNTDIGTSAQIKVYTGTPPATVATAFTGTLLVQYAGNAGGFGSAASGQLTASAVANATASATGTAGYFRIATSGGTDVAQGTVYPNTVLSTSALTAANGNVLTFTSTTGIVVGQTISGTGVAAGCTAVAVTSTTVTMSLTSTAGVANAASITFGGDMTVTNASIANGQACSFSSLVITANGA